ncbi:inositol monophosphatase [Aeoliella sp. ICT_H6.2]|uniref:Inositol monophosphatase n=1 Tax=Aeoliella straminimaris TaxID=2954799 RepID=A0A9X2FFI9_9BACT|nr:inositol monophosphatase family protein [Aeoliella straminimaris]MCO6047258.1 inositol monophosphatase [Aeoliella straminimaris]
MTTQLETETKARLDWAVEIARHAGDVTLEYFRNPNLRVERKGDDSPVTAADKGAEKLLRERIAERFGDDAIVGEEYGQTPGTSGFVWVLDPIDGTKSFIHGIPLYTTLIGVLHTSDGKVENGTTQLGVIRAPALDEVIYARRGGGAWHQRGDGEPVRAAIEPDRPLAEGLLLTSEVGSFRKRKSGRGMETYLALDERVRLARTWGDAYGYLMVATGRADVMIDPEMNLWDAAALQPVIEEAGGVFCDWQGTATVHSGEAIAGNAAAMREVLEITRGK